MLVLCIDHNLNTEANLVHVEALLETNMFSNKMKTKQYYMYIYLKYTRNCISSRGGQIIL